MAGRVYFRTSMPEGLIRAPRAWWKPESRRDLENMMGMWAFNDGQITTDDDPCLLDREQGIPHMKGTPCSIVRLSDEEVAQLEAEFGPTDELPHGPEGKMVRCKGRDADFMYDEDFEEGVEFDAAALSLYGRYSL